SARSWRRVRCASPGPWSGRGRRAACRPCGDARDRRRRGAPPAPAPAARPGTRRPLGLARLPAGLGGRRLGALLGRRGAGRAFLRLLVFLGLLLLGAFEVVEEDRVLFEQPEPLHALLHLDVAGGEVEDAHLVPARTAAGAGGRAAASAAGAARAG